MSLIITKFGRHYIVDTDNFVRSWSLDIVYVVPAVAVVAPAAHVVAKLDIVVQVAADKVHGLVDLHGLGELAVGLQVPGLDRYIDR